MKKSDKKINNKLEELSNLLRLIYRYLYNHNNASNHENWQTPEFIK